MWLQGEGLECEFRQPRARAAFSNWLIIARRHLS
jgi:hypothetical protein